MKGWTSVDEKLPEDYDTCLVFNDSKIYFGAYHNGDWAYMDYPGGYTFYRNDVTHWMPLPCPPKES